jgi:transposase-like protein
MIEPGLSTPQKWREVVGEQRASGLSVAVFCRRRGIVPSSFYRWMGKLGRGAGAGAFVEAKLVPAGSPAPRPAGMIEVRLRGGRRVRVSRDGFDRELLMDVVAALEGMAPKSEGRS